MEVKLLLTADYANETAEKKLNIMGIFSSIGSVAFPTIHPLMYIVTQLEAKAAEYGRNFKLLIKLLDEDAGEVLAIGTDGQIPHANDGQPVNINLTLGVGNVIFPKPGVYEVSVLVDNDVKAIYPIRLLQLQPVSGE